MPERKKLIRTHCLFIFFLVFAIYGNTLSHQYALDDTIFIVGNKYTQKGIEGIPDILTHDAFVGAYGQALELSGGRYRPLSLVMFAVEYELFGLNPFPGHLINLLLYALTGIFLYLLLMRLLPDQNLWVPLITSVLFIVHPIHTEVVANIKSRDEILGLLLLIGVLYTLFKGKRSYLAVSAVLYFFALLSKENAITALAIIPMTLYFFSDSKLKSILLKTIPFVVVAVIYLLLRANYAGTLGDRESTDIMDNPFLHASAADKYATITYIAGKYIALLFFPHPLSYDYSYNQIPIINWTNLKAIFSFLIFAGMSIYALINIRKRSILAYGILFYLITFSIVSNVVFNIGAPMGERFIYLSSLGFCLCLSVLLAKLLKVNTGDRFNYNIKWLIPLLLIVSTASYATVARNRVWKNNLTLYETDVKTAPNSARTHMYYGVILINRSGKQPKSDMLNTAIDELRKAVEINPKFYHAYYNLGVAYQQKSDHDAAIACFNKVLEMQPLHIKSHYCLGISYGKGKGELDKAIYYLEKAMSFNYKRPECYDNLGIAYAMKGEYDRAIAVFEEGIQKYPENAKLYMNLGITYANTNDTESADQYYQKAFALDPSLRK